MWLLQTQIRGAWGATRHQGLRKVNTNVHLQEEDLRDVVPQHSVLLLLHDEDHRERKYVREVVTTMNFFIIAIGVLAHKMEPRRDLPQERIVYIFLL